MKEEIFVKELLSNATRNTNIIASNIMVGEDAIIKTGEDFNLISANDTTYKSSKESILEVEVGAKVGNAYVDAGYAWKAVIDAQLKVIEAIEKLNKMKRLKDEGKASQKAVDFAILQVALAQAQVYSAKIAATSATAGAALAAKTSLGTGFYTAAYMDITSTGIKQTNTSSIAVGSSLIANNSIDINSNNNLNINGSIIESLNSNITLNAINDINITASENKITANSKQETKSLSASVGNNGIQASIGYSEGESDYQKIFYTNSQLTANNGNINLNSNNDTNIIGANLLAKNLIINTTNNLNIESKQTEEYATSSGLERPSLSCKYFICNEMAGKTIDNRFEQIAGEAMLNPGNGFNVGGGVSATGGASASLGFNMNNSEMTRTWTDELTTLKGTNSITINTGNDLNLTGAAILSDNLNLNIQGNINKKDLEDTYYSESMGAGIQLSIPINGGTTTSTNNSNSTSNSTSSSNNNQSPAQGSPKGSTTISASYQQNEAKRTTYATIGSLSDYNNGELALVSDTNIFVSGLFFAKSNAGKILNLCFEEKINLCLSNELIAEIEKVLFYPKIKKRLNLSQIEIENYCSILRFKFEVFSIKNVKANVDKDKNDNHILATLIASKADYLITGDDDLLSMSNKYKIIPNPNTLSLRERTEIKDFSDTISYLKIVNGIISPKDFIEKML